MVIAINYPTFISLTDVYSMSLYQNSILNKGSNAVNLNDIEDRIVGHKRNQPYFIHVFVSHFTIISSFMFALLLVGVYGCKDATSTLSNHMVENVDQTGHTLIESDQLGQHNQSSVLYDELSPIFDDQTIKTIQSLKRDFEKGLAGGASYDELSELYRFHAQRMKVDFLNRFPFTENYPYVQKQQFIKPDMLAKLPFLTDVCGYLINDSDKVNFPCFTKENDLFTFFQEASESNSLITRVITEYNTALGVTPSIQNGLLMNSIDQLNFDREADQLFYAFFHIILNDEWVISQELRAKSPPLEK